MVSRKISLFEKMQRGRSPSFEHFQLDMYATKYPGHKYTPMSSRVTALWPRPSELLALHTPLCARVSHCDVVDICTYQWVPAWQPCDPALRSCWLYTRMCLCLPLWRCRYICTYQWVPEWQPCGPAPRSCWPYTRMCLCLPLWRCRYICTYQWVPEWQPCDPALRSCWLYTRMCLCLPLWRCRCGGYLLEERTYRVYTGSFKIHCHLYYWNNINLITWLLRLVEMLGP